MTQETKIITGIGVVTLAIVGFAAFFLGGNSSSSAVTSEKKIDQAVLLRNAKHTIASKGAKVTVVEFADYQCPACGAAYPVTKQIIEEYKGKVTFVFRNFPLSMHANAKPAAEAAEAAGAQGQYWEMHDKLYENQDKWAELKDAVPTFVDYAKELKLDVNKFEEAVKKEQFKDSIEKDINDGTAIGINATPTFFINGEQFSRVLSYDEFKSLLDKALKAK